MPSVLKVVLVRGRAVPWMRVWIATQWLFRFGRERLNKNLSERERRELRDLAGKSRGIPGNLSDRERGRLLALVRQAALG